MIGNQTQNQTPIPQAAADTPQPPMLSPDEAVTELRALQARVPEIAELTPQERSLLRNSFAITEAAIQASIGVLDASVEVANIVALPDDVRQRNEEVGRWTTFENELKVTLQRVADANIVRRQRIRLLAVQAYLIGQQVARTPGNAGLATHVKEVKRLRARRKKAAPSPDSGTPKTSVTS